MRTQSVNLLGGLTTLALSLCSFSVFPASPNDGVLAFDPDSYTTLNVTVGEEPLEVRRYQVVYVAKPVKMASIQPPRRMGGRGTGRARQPNARPTPRSGRSPNPNVPADPDVPGQGTPSSDPYSYQSMYIYVPQSAYNDAETATILQVGNAGWFASEARQSVQEGGEYVGNSDTDRVGVALRAGYVIASAGTRSRGAMAADGYWAGKAPAVVVDAKAAIRYLRLNEAVIPGSSERIIITGSSGGGGLSVAVAASGNSPDYFPYLAEIGAAGMDENGNSSIRDDVFATVAYCPITDLGHADIAYEWQYNAVRNALNNARGEYTDQMQKASAELAAAYPAYLAGLGLRLEDGTPLTADNMDDAIVAQLKKEAEEAIAEGIDIPAIGEDFVLTSRAGSQALANDWLTVNNGEVVDINYGNFLRFVTNATALKTVPSFDVKANTGNEGVRGENTLFGLDSKEYSNFTEYAWNNNEVKGDGSGLDDAGIDWDTYIANPATRLDEQLKMVNPMPYLNSDADSAPYWYVRHGMVDRDTAFAIEVALYHALDNNSSVKDVSFELAWLKPHGGNYDVQEAYAWIARILAEAGR